MGKSITEIFREYGITVKEIAQRREFPGFDFSIFKGMDEQYDKIRSNYKRIAQSGDYSAEYKLAKSRLLRRRHDLDR